MGAEYNPPPVMNSQTKILNFEAIPVIDLMGGKVVRARHGERGKYQPIASQLCMGSEPLDITHALLGLYPFKTLYIADLDAILGWENHLATCKKLRQVFTDLEIWVDAGFTDIHSCQPWLDMGMNCVIGSESQSDEDAAFRLLEELGAVHAILSLDFLGSTFSGPGGLLNQPMHWPERIIAMTLGRVGSYIGPDFSLLEYIKSQAGSRALFAAGGTRDLEDMRQLKQMGVAGTLLASTLHDGKIGSDDLFSICNS